MDEIEVKPWVPDEVCDSCQQCNVRFTVIRRRHHCRICGQLLCFECNDHWVMLPADKKPEKDAHLMMSPVCFLCQLRVLCIEPEQHWELLGGASGPPLLVLPDALLTRASVHRRARLLAQRGFRVCLADHCGLGSRFHEQMSERGAMEAIQAACQALGAQVHILGLGMGGYLAYKYLNSYPHNVRSISIVGATCENTGLALLLLYSLLDGAYKLTTRNLAMALLLKHFEDANLSDMDKHDLLTGGFTFQKSAQCKNYMLPGAQGYLDILRTSSVPALFINGEMDTLNEKQQDAFLQAARAGHDGSELYVVPNCSQEAAFSDSSFEDVATKLFDFCSKHDHPSFQQTQIESTSGNDRFASLVDH